MSFIRWGGVLKLGLNQPKSSPEVRFNENGSKDLERSGLDVAFGEGHGNMIFLVHKNMVILIVFTGGGCL